LFGTICGLLEALTTAASQWLAQAAIGRFSGWRRWTSPWSQPIMTIVTQSVEQVVDRFNKAAARLREQHRDPKKARAFLLRAGIAVKSKSSPTGIRLARRFR
jgi:uncharacterized membrane protein YhiD involved in acid resistance